MANQVKPGRKAKAPTPRQLEIKRLTGIGREKRTDQESARLDQMKKEERRERFLRLAVKRTMNAAKALRNVQRMANQSVYEYTGDEAAKICAKVTDAAKSVIDAFDNKQKVEDSFTL